MRKIALLAVLMLVSGCIFFPPPPEDKYSLFSYLPSDGATGAFLVDVKEPAFSEITSLLGKLLSGKVGYVKGMQIAVLSYDDGSSAGIIQMRTNLSIGEVLEGIPTYSLGIGSSSPEFVNETKRIGNRDVTLLYSKDDTSKKNPLCTWREGDWLKVLYYQKGYSSSYPQCTFPAGFSCVSYDINGNNELYIKLGQGTGHSIKVNSILCTSSTDYKEYMNVNTPLLNPVSIDSGSAADIAGGSSGNTITCNGISGGKFSGRIYINYTETDTGLSRIAAGTLYVSLAGNATKEKRCDTILESTYDTTNAKELLAESASIGGSLTASGTMFGEGMASFNNQSVYMAAFGDDDGDYGVGIIEGSSQGSNMCYSGMGSSGNSAEIVKRGSMEACIMGYSGGGVSDVYSLLGAGKQFLTMQRKVGNYSIMLIAYVKGDKEKVKSNAEDIVFGINLPGEEVSWTDRMNLHVKVYETFEGSFDRQPVADAKVELYNESYAYPVYDSYGAGKQEPIKTAYTDDNGIVDFVNIDIGDYNIVTSKPGYSKDTEYVYPGGSSNISIMLQKLEPLRVNVREGSYSSSVPVAEAKVVLYNGSSIFADGGAGGYTQNYEVIDTKYTNASGVADFGKRSIENGKIVVSKESYEDYNTYLSTYSRNITVYLTKKYNYYNYSGEPFTVTVRSYDTSGLTLNNIEGAKVSIYNKTSVGSYTLAMTNYTDSNGVAKLNGGNIVTGKVTVEKEGYGAYSEYFYYYNTRNIMVYLSLANLNQTYGYNKPSAPAENCSGNYTLRVWPSDAATATCTDSNGAVIPSTGENAADWFNYGGCGGWKTYNVTPGSQVMIQGYSDSCAGCSLWHINYYLHDYYNSTWHNVGYVDGPDELGATYDFCYTPKGNRINIEAETGFYVKVFKKG